MNFFKRLFGKIKTNEELKESVKESIADVVDLVKETTNEDEAVKSARETLLKRLR